VIVKLGKDSSAKMYVAKIADAWKSLIGLQVIVKEVDPTVPRGNAQEDFTLALST